MKESDRILGIRLGAIFRISAERGFDRQTVEHLLTRRAYLSEAAAHSLAGFWFKTGPFRRLAA